MKFENKIPAVITIGGKDVNKIKIGGEVVWEKKVEPVDADYLYIENTYNGSNTIYFFTTQSGIHPSSDKYSNQVEYSTDKVNWTTLTFNPSTPQTVVINTGEKLYLRNDTGVFNYYNGSANTYNTNINVSQSNIIGGNINTLLDYKNPDTVPLSHSCFFGLFRDNIATTDVSGLKFGNKTLTTGCYREMFNNCSKITNGPELPATTLSDSSYNGIFKNCSSLKTVKISAKNISATNCLTEWLYGCANTGTVYNLGKVNIPYFTDSGIRRGWVECNYSDKHSDDYFWFKNTYNGSNNLHFTREISGSPSSSNYTTTVEWSKDKKKWTKMTIGSSNSISLAKNETVYLRNDTGKFSYYNGDSNARCYYKISGDYSYTVGGDLRTLINYKNVVDLSLKNGVFAYLFYYDSKITSTSSLTFKYHTISRYGFYSCFDNDNSLTATPSVLHPVNLNPYCYYRMYNSTNIKNTPVLPSQTLKERCYVQLFASCNDFSSVTSYANNISATSCLENWMNGVKSSGTFHNLGTASYPRNASGVPNGWTIVKN